MELKTRYDLITKRSGNCFIGATETCDWITKSHGIGWLFNHKIRYLSELYHKNAVHDGLTWNGNSVALEMQIHTLCFALVMQTYGNWILFFYLWCKSAISYYSSCFFNQRKYWNICTVRCCEWFILFLINLMYTSLLTVDSPKGKYPRNGTICFVWI